MQRRRFVQLSGSTIATALAGCMGGGDDGDSDDSDTPDEAFGVGETAQYEGLEATVYGYDLVEAYEEWSSRYDGYPSDDGKEFYETPPSGGGIFMFVDFGIKNVGEERTPIAGVGQYEEGISGTYGGSSIEFFAPENTVRSRSNEHEYEDVFSAKVIEENAIEKGIFPGYELRGWVICEVSHDLERDLFEMNVDLAANREELDSYVVDFSISNDTPNRTPEGYDREFEDSSGEESSDGESGDGESTDEGETTSDGSGSDDSDNSTDEGSTNSSE